MVSINSIIAVRYIDALYFTNKNIDFGGFPEHVTMGRIFKKEEDYIGVSFSDKNSFPQKGLLLPTGSLILDAKKSKKFTPEIKTGIVGVFWKDITYFDNDKLPKDCTTIYTEGEFFSTQKEALIIKNPKTIKIGEIVSGHPEKRKKIYFCAIPWSIITSIENYD